jgi:hypothetical protein
LALKVINPDLCCSILLVPLRPLGCFEYRVAIREKAETPITVSTQPNDTMVDRVHESTVVWRIKSQRSGRDMEGGEKGINFKDAS